MLKDFKSLILLIILLFLERYGYAQGMQVVAEEAAENPAQELAIGGVSQLLKPASSLVNPGDNFYLYANRAWLSDVEINSDSLSAGASREAVTRTKAQVSALEADLLGRDWPQGSDEAKYKTVFNAFLNEGRVSRRGLRPVRQTLREIRSIRNHKQVAVLLGGYWIDAGGLFRVSLRISQHEGRTYIPHLGPADLILGEPHLYLGQDELAQSARAEAAIVLGKLLRRGGGRSNLARRTAEVIELETRLAALAPAATDERDPLRVMPLRPASSLASEAPDFPWSTYFVSRGLGVDAQVSIAPFQDLEAIARVFEQTPVRVWRDYLTLRILLKYGAYLSEDISLLTEEVGQLRTGVRLPRKSRYERASDFAQWVLPDVMARRYVETHLDAGTLAAAEAMAERIRGVYRRRIMQADWLGEQTRTQALAKLDGLAFMIGVPPDWNDHSNYQPEADDLFGNAYQKFQSRHLTRLARLRERPVDGVRDIDELRQHIFFSPLRVGAYYLPRLNAVIVPAAYLQPPFFDPAADDAYNYGALGTTLGHEIGHAFDDQGSKHGPTGELENWWTDEDRARFDAMGAELSAQFAGAEVVPGVPIDTQLTLGENISDIVGVETALAGLLDLLDQDPSMSASERRTSLQDFFLSYAGKRRKVRRPETDALFLPRDKHSPPELRTNLILANIDAWYRAFGITETDALWLAPEQRLRFW